MVVGNTIPISDIYIQDINISDSVGKLKGIWS